MFEPEDLEHPSIAPEEREAIGKLLRINEQNLDSDMAACSSYYYHYGALAADAAQLVKQAQLQLDVYEAQLAKALRITAAQRRTASEQTPILTRKTPRAPRAPGEDFEKEADLHRAYALDAQWGQLRGALIQAEYYAAITDRIARAFDMKSGLLRSMNRRQLFQKGQRLDD